MDLSQEQYSFLISAEDWGPPILSTVVTVKVIVPLKVSQNVDSTDTTVEFVTAVTEGASPNAVQVTTERPKDIPIVEGEHLGPDQGIQEVQPSELKELVLLKKRFSCQIYSTCLRLFNQGRLAHWIVSWTSSCHLQ